jgi:hypothetical protein
MAITITAGLLVGSESSGCVGFMEHGKTLIPCGKIPSPTSARCPRCEVLAAYEAEAPARRAEKARRTVETWRANLAFLASSPLAAVNPDFDLATSSERRLSRRPHAISRRTITAGERKEMAAKPAREGRVLRIAAT